MGKYSFELFPSMMTGLVRAGGLPVSVFSVKVVLGPSPMELTADNSIL